jgi:heme exporter protein D
MNEFLAMGGYAAYVWPAYGVAASILVGLWVASVRELRTRESDIEAAEATNPRRGGK